MRKISATYIFPANRPPIKHGILVCDDEGTVLEVLENKNYQREEAGLEFYSGIIVPGFINAHCHLELSYMKGKIPEKKGMGNFLKHINRLRNEHTENQQEIFRKADRKMWADGIAAVGDTANSSATISTKLKSKIYYHTFVESFGFHPSRAEKSFSIAEAVYNQFTENRLPASIVPHSAYSVSKPLFQMIRKKAMERNSILSVHNQESEAEKYFFSSGAGAIADHYEKNLGIETSHWKPEGKSSFITVLHYLPPENQLLLIHNTFSQKKDIDDLRKRRSPDNTFWVICALSNLFIENKLPPLDLFQKENLNICLGTDSLASNHQLSILDEMIVLQQNLPKISIENLITWACLNGARALNIEKLLGSFEVGKNPGVNLISGVDLTNMKLTKNSKVKRLM